MTTSRRDTNARETRYINRILDENINLHIENNNMDVTLQNRKKTDDVLFLVKITLFLIVLLVFLISILGDINTRITECVNKSDLLSNETQHQFLKDCVQSVYYSQNYFRQNP